MNGGFFGDGPIGVGAHLTVVGSRHRHSVDFVVIQWVLVVIKRYLVVASVDSRYLRVRGSGRSRA